METRTQEFVYIMVSKTDTLLGMMIQKMLGVAYNHCSISLDDSLEAIYSVGRKECWNMFDAGFVVESKNSGFFGAHNQSDIVLLRIPVSHQEKQQLHRTITDYQKTTWKYNLLGLLYCYRGIQKDRENRLFCSQFVAQVLKQSGIDVLDKPASLVRPHDFLSVPSAESVYVGKIGQYQSA